MKKTLTALLLFIMTIVMAIAATGCSNGDDSSSPSDSSSQSQSSGGDSSGGGQQETKKDAAAVTDLSVSTKAVAAFTALDGFEYQFVIDGSEVDVEEMNGRYDVSEFVSSASKTHTVAVYSKENDEYKKSAQSNVVNVKAIDVDNVNFAITADKKVSFNAVEGYKYFLSVNGKEKEVTSGQDVSELLSGGEKTSMIVKLVIKGGVSGDTVTLDTEANEIFTITWHKEITDLTYENGVVKFASELNYTYDLYANNAILKENVASGDDVSALIAAKTDKEITLYVKVKENATKSAFVSADNEESNKVVLKFLSAPEVSATVNNGKVTLTITDTENTGVEGLGYELFIDGVSVGTVTDEQDVSALFTKKGEAKLTLKATAEGYISSEVGEESTVEVPDYNRFHFVADNKDKAEIGGVYGKTVTVKALEEGVKISSDITVDLTKASKKSAIIAINNPSDHPAGIEKITIDIVSATNADKFIRIVATSGINGYNAHIYGGFGADFKGSVRETVDDGTGNYVYALVDATYGQIVDYNILWAALGLGKLEGDQGANDGWNYNQKRQLTLVYDGGKIGYYSPACEFIPIMNLSGVEGFAATDFANAKLNFTFDKLISKEKAGYTNATHTLEIYGNGEDYADDFRIGQIGFDITRTGINDYKGIYLYVSRVGQAGFVSNNGWPALDGTYKDNILVNGKHYDGIVMKLTEDSSRPYLDIESVKSIVENSAFFKKAVCICIPKGSTFTYDNGTTEDTSDDKIWTTNFDIKVCSAYGEDGTISWQVCTHDSHEYIADNEIAVTIDSKVDRSQEWCLEMHLKDTNGNDVALPANKVATVNGTVLVNGSVVSNPVIKTSDIDGGSTGNYLLQIVTIDNVVFENNDGFKAARDAGTEYTLTVKRGTIITVEGINYGVTRDITFELSGSGADYKWRVAPDCVAAKISSTQDKGANVAFEFVGEKNDFIKESWETAVTVPSGAVFYDSVTKAESALVIKRAGDGDQAKFFIDNKYTSGNHNLAVGDKITFKAGRYYNSSTALGITLDKDYVLEWNGSAWELKEN